jgi:ACT domain-containing protein
VHVCQLLLQLSDAAGMLIQLLLQLSDAAGMLIQLLQLVPAHVAAALQLLLKLQQGCVQYKTAAEVSA